MICDECGVKMSSSYAYDDRRICKKCYDMLNFFHIFFYDQKIKIFVDVFNADDIYYYNILVFDFINKDFISRTVASESDNIYEAKYNVILFICEYITDFPSVTIYSDFKIMKNHLDETYSKKSPKMRGKYYKLLRYLKKGLKIEFIEPEHNMARICPQSFRFFHLFEDYKRRVSFQYKKGERRE